MQLQMARRQVDEQPADAARAHRDELGRDQLDMPVHREQGARIELAKGAPREAEESRRSSTSRLESGSLRAQSLEQVLDHLLVGRAEGRPLGRHTKTGGGCFSHRLRT
jgi:hypothetical protein